MRRIITQEEKERKDKMNKLIIGLVLVAIMLFSTAGYAFFSGEKISTSEKITYNGIVFSKGENGLWNFEYQGAQFATQYYPEETKNISASILRSAGDYSGKPLFLLGQGEARQEIISNLRVMVPRMQEGCIEGYEDKCNNETPIKDCSLDNVIVFEETNDTKITQEESCIFIKAPYEEQARAGDAFIFKLLGI